MRSTGLEFSKRDLEVPWFGQDTPASPFTMREADWNEKFARAYLYWTPHNWFALTAEYLYEKFHRAEDYNAGIQEAKTHSIPLGIRFFHPCGLGFSLRGTYYNQEGNFIRKDTLTYDSGSDEFWLVDAAISYRLPKRYGFVTVGVTNLFDKEFNYAEPDVNNPRIQPDRFFFTKGTLAIP